MKLKIYQVDAFSDQPFGGNPAAVCPLTEWLEDELMQKIALENNLSETAFYIPENGNYHIRWFTPTHEVDLCGHATLATAHVLYHHLGYTDSQLIFNSRSGALVVSSLEEGKYCMDFPTDQINACAPIQEIIEALSAEPNHYFKGRDDYMVVLDSQEQIEQLQPDFRKISRLNSRGLIVTAPGREVDFVSRGFFPQSGVDEDPATGSAHTTLTPYWSEVLGKQELTALQLSKRLGKFQCNLKGERVEIIGNACSYLVGDIWV